MYKLAYSEAVTDSGGEARAREHEALGRSIELLQLAHDAGPNSNEEIVALAFLRELWTVLIEDLASPQNALPHVLRAQLISIGISLLRQAEDIRQGRQSDFSPLIEISRLIMGGLK